MKKCNIREIKAREIFDSRANPTVEVEVILENGIMGRGIVPSGASTGRYEALELRDTDSPRLNGKGVRTAISNIQNIIAPELIGMNIFDLAAIDQKMIHLDSTPNKAALGANAILGISIASAWAGANAAGQPLYHYLGGQHARTLPLPMIQIIGGGAHAAGCIDIQDFLVIPLSASSFSQGYDMAVNVYNAAKKVFQKYHKPLSIADEGGFWPSGFQANHDGLDLLVEAIQGAGYHPGTDLGIALDIASSEFYKEDSQSYYFALEDRTFSREEFVEYLCGLANKYPIVSMEDGMSEYDWEGGKMLTKRLGNRIQLIGDDLFTTNLARIRRGVQEEVYNSVLIKMNQIGTVTETLTAIEFTKNAGYKPVISARSGETEDVTIAHLAVAGNAGQLKVGSVTRSERTAKWNEVLRIQEALGTSGLYPGSEVIKF